MQVEISGTSPSNFIVTVSDAAGTPQQYDIAAELKIDNGDGLPGEVAKSAAIEHFWHQLAVDAEKERREFEELRWAQYAAHTDRYARYYLRAIGDKNPTLADKRTAAVLLFSKDTKNDPIAVQAAYNGYANECKSVGVAPASKEVFVDEMMYMYEGDFEDAKTMMLALEYAADRLKAVAAAFNAKSWAVKTLAADRRALIGANI